jgi:nucleoside-diphosphate-sugar epimerase
VRVAVTGASGFIGGAVARDLLARGHAVIGFGRRPGVPGVGDYRIWDLNAGPLAEPPRVDAVVHAAALADDWAPRDVARAVNVGGSAAVAASFPGARFVHLSSSSVYDAHTATVGASEATPPATRFLSNYSRSKAAAERVFDGLDAVILRPHAVYGAGDTTLLPRLIAAVRDGRLVLPSGGRVLHTLTSIDNLTRAITLAIDAGTPSETFNVGDAEPVLLSDAVSELLRKKTGSEVGLRSVPYPVAFAAAAAAEALARVTGRRPWMTRYAVSQLGRERTLDLTAARERLGFDPSPTSLEGAETW